MEAGDVDAQIELGKIYDRGKGIVRIDFEEAERLLRPLAEKGNAKAQLELGYLYDPQNMRLRDYIDKRTKQVYDSLANEVALYARKLFLSDSLFDHTLDTNTKQIESEEWISREYIRFAVPYSPGHRISPYLSDSIYYRIRDSIATEMDAEKWFLKAANQGLPEAMCALAWLMETAWASRTPHDEFYWYEKAAELDYTHAQSYLGELYSYAMRDLSNMSRSYFWLKIAADKNDERARSNFERVQKEITEKELREAQKLLDDWHKRHKK